MKQPTNVLNFNPQSRHK